MDGVVEVVFVAAVAVGPALVIALGTWRSRLRRMPIRGRHAIMIFAIGAICSTGIDAHTVMPAILFLLFPNERLFWLGWMFATGAVVLIVGSLSRWRRPGG